MDAAYINKAISALEAHRDILGSDVVDTSLQALRRLRHTAPQMSAHPVEARDVTVLVARFSGMRLFCDALRADEAEKFAAELWQHLDARIAENGGIVVSRNGYTLIAVFGADAPRQNETEWAIRAGLDIRKITARLHQDWVEKQTPPVQLPPLNVSMGLHGGSVLWHADVSRSVIEVWGDVVEIAWGLATYAFPGRIFISEHIYRQVRGVFYVRQMPQLYEISLLPQNVRAFEVTGAKPYAVRVISHSIEGVETTMVGRSDAMKILQTAFDTAGHGAGQLLTISGTAGIGKSRLLFEFDRWLEEQPHTVRLLQGRASLPTRQLPYWIFRDIFTFYFGIFASDSTEITRQKLSQGILNLTQAADGTAETMATHLERLVGFSSDVPVPYPTAPEKKVLAAAVAAVIDFFAMLADADSPVVLLLEDIHWADDASLRLLNQLWQASRQLPLMIVCTTQPQLFERDPKWATADEPNRQTISLPPLNSAQMAQLIRQIFRKIHVIPPDLHQMLLTKSKGNPLLLEELIQLLIDDGVILPFPTRWRVDEKALAAIHLPADLHAVLQQRFSRLPALEQEMLQRAAAIGRAFWNVALAQMREAHAAPISVEVVNVVLENLQERGLILQRESSPFAKTREYIFKHAALQQAIYDTLSPSMRVVYHTQLADWLIEFNGEQVDVYAALIADHFLAAQQPLAGAMWLIRAGKQALTVFAWDVATTQFQKAQQILSSVPTEKIPPELVRDITCGLAMSLWWQAETETAERPATSLFEATLAYAEECGSNELQARVLQYWANAEKKAGNSARADILLQQAQSILP